MVGGFGAAAKSTPQSIAGRYADNPADPVVGADAWSGARLAAHYVTCPARFLVEGRPLRGLLSLNTATHPDFQGRGLFTRLAQATYAAGTEQGYDFVFGVANANSTPGFTRKLGFQLVAPLEAGVLLRTPRRLSDRPVQFAADWTEELMAWRLANPAAEYRAAAQGETTGVWAPTHLPLVNCAAFLPGRRAPSRAGPLAASLFIGLEPRLDLTRLGLLRLPERFRPSPLNLIYRPLSDRAPGALDPSSVAVSFLDFDPY